MIISRSKKTNASVLVKNSNNSMLAAEKRISIILALISLSFLVLTAPVFILENLDERVFQKPGASLILSIAYALMYSNHVINFFFYCSIGPNFRKEVKRLMFRGSRVSATGIDYKLTRVNTALIIAAASTTVQRTSGRRRAFAATATVAQYSQQRTLPPLIASPTVTFSSKPAIQPLKALPPPRPPPPKPPRPPPPKLTVDIDPEITEQTSL